MCFHRNILENHPLFALLKVYGDECLSIFLVIIEGREVNTDDLRP